MRQWKYENLLSIPQGQRGDVHVRHKVYAPGSVLRTCSGRTMILGGHRWPPYTITGTQPATFHELSYQGGVWVTDEPIEQVQHHASTQGFSGRVLLGGLGLGIAATLLGRRLSVESITVVEKDPRVIELVAPYLRHGRLKHKLTVIEADLSTYLRELPKRKIRFDYAFYDIWQADSEDTFWRYVMPLRKLSAGKVRHVACWNEDIMRGQLLNGLRSRIDAVRFEMPYRIDPDGVKHLYTREVLATPCGDRWHDWYTPFFKEHDPLHHAAHVEAQRFVRDLGIV